MPSQAVTVPVLFHRAAGPPPKIRRLCGAYQSAAVHHARLNAERSGPAMCQVHRNLLQVCKVAPIPGETKVWQYITLIKRIFLIDCPGVVYHKTDDSDTQAVLKGVVRVENLVSLPPEHRPALPVTGEENALASCSGRARQGFGCFCPFSNVEELQTGVTRDRERA